MKKGKEPQYSKWKITKFFYYYYFSMIVLSCRVLEAARVGILVSASVSTSSFWRVFLCFFLYFPSLFSVCFPSKCLTVRFYSNSSLPLSLSLPLYIIFLGFFPLVMKPLFSSVLCLELHKLKKRKIKKN